MDYLKYIAWFVPSLLGFAGNWFFKFTEDDPEKTHRKRLTSPGKGAICISILCLGFAAYSTYVDQRAAIQRAEKAKSIQTALDQANEKLDQTLAMLNKNIEYVGSRKGECSVEAITFTMKDGLLLVPTSGSVLVELESLTKVLAWQCGETKRISRNEQSFDVLRCERTLNGDVVWTFYRQI